MADGDHGWRLPAYGEGSLADVLPAVGRSLGVSTDLPATGLVLPEASAWVVVLVDGLGSRLLAEHPVDAPYLTDLRRGHAVVSRELTVGVPSTTATSITSLGTGLPPGRHGVVGYTSRVPETGALLNSLKWDQPVVPEEWQPEPTAFGLLAGAGAYAAVVSERGFVDSGLTRCSQRGADYVPAQGAEEQVDGVREALSRAAGRPAVVYLYESAVDHAGHGHGVDSSAWRAALSHADDLVAWVREETPPEVRIAVVADHGMVDCPAEHRIDVDDEPDLLAGVDLLGGEARFRHLYCGAGAAQDVAAAWRGRLAGRAEVRLREEAEAEGWFGPVADRVRPRLGDVVVACREETTVVSRSRFPVELKMTGFHGSLTATEMDVPLLVC